MVRRFILIPAVVAAASWFPGCADDGTSLRIECPLVPQRDDDGCTYDAGDDTCVLGGAMNLQESRGYTLVLRATNGLVPRESDIPLKVESNNMDVTSAEVTLVSNGGEVIDFGDLPNPYSQAASGRIPLEGAGEATVLAIPPDYVRAMRDNDFEVVEGTIVVLLRLNARTDGDVDVTSRTWRWPISLSSELSDPDNCIPADEPRRQCNLGQENELYRYCTNLP